MTDAQTEPAPESAAEETSLAGFAEQAELAHAPTQLDPDAEPVLEVEDLRMYFPVKSSGLFRRTVGHVQAVDGVSFQVPRGGSLGLVGESGCGKSTTGRLITRLYTPTGGSMRFGGKDMAKLSLREMKPLRRDVQMIFQDPYTSLNPRHTVGAIVGAPLSVHNIVPKKEILPRVQELLEVVGLNPEHYNRYPNEFSGGQRQRIGIARALTLNPKLLVADEPVSALDVSIQAQVVNLLQDLQREFEIAFLFIAHDLAVVRHFCPGWRSCTSGIVEIADRETLYLRPHHPYTQALLSAVPDVKQAAIGGRRERIRLEATYPARSTRRPAAGSAPGARSPRTSAPRSSRRCCRSASGTRSPATSPESWVSIPPSRSPRDYSASITRETRLLEKAALPSSTPAPPTPTPGSTSKAGAWARPDAWWMTRASSRPSR